MESHVLRTTLARAFVTERVITFATRIVDIPMVAILAWDSSLKGVSIAFIAMTPIYFILCCLVVFISDKAHEKGLDLTGIETLLGLKDGTIRSNERSKKAKQRLLIVQWMLGMVWFQKVIKLLRLAALLMSQRFKHLVFWILKSPKLIFWIGSWFYLDPDYVTLLLRRRGDGYVRTFLGITLPSVILSMVVWLGIWWAAVQGFLWAVWLLEWIL